MNLDEITLLGKNEFIIMMVLDCLESNSLFPKVTIYNNLNLQPEENFINKKFEIVLSNTLKLSKNVFICLNKKKSIDNLISFENIDVDSLITLKHKNSYVSSTTMIGKNCLISSMVSIAHYSNLENFVRVNRNCSIGHHVEIGRNVNLNPGVNIGGYSTIGENTTIGMGSNILNKIKIGKNSVIGAGSLITKDIPDGVVAYGSPCKIIRENIY